LAFAEGDDVPGCQPDGGLAAAVAVGRCAGPARSVLAFCHLRHKIHKNRGPWC
jgi:hypothetical protein